jgi:DNA-binding transcriptional LysR family regulator
MKTEYRAKAGPSEKTAAPTFAGVTESDEVVPRLINRLRLKHWALLAALADTPVLNLAAQRLTITQPAATKMLADLEQAFGFPLFDRHPRGLRATTLGQQVIGYARQAQAGLARFIEDLEVRRRGGQGQLVIGAIMGAAPDVVARAVARLKSERPLLNVRIVGETSDQIAALLERHEVELAVGRMASVLHHDLFEFSPLANETLRVVARTDHPLARRRGLTLASLMDWPWILQPLASPARQVLEGELAQANLGTPRNAVECSSIFAILQLLQATHAVAVVSESVVRDHVRARILRTLPIAVGVDLKGFGVLTRRAEVLSEPATVLVRYLRDAAAAVVPFS